MRQPARRTRIARAWFATGCGITGFLCLVLVLGSPESLPNQLLRAIGVDLHQARKGVDALAIRRFVVFKEGWDRPATVLPTESSDWYYPPPPAECRTVEVHLLLGMHRESSLWMPQRWVYDGHISFYHMCRFVEPSAGEAAKARRAFVAALRDDPEIAAHFLFNPDAILAAEIPQSGPLGSVSVRWTEPIPAGAVFNIASAAVVGSTVVAGVLCLAGKRRRLASHDRADDHAEADRPSPPDAPDADHNTRAE